jgi:hypothetical protein
LSEAGLSSALREAVVSVKGIRLAESIGRQQLLLDGEPETIATEALTRFYAGLGAAAEVA